MSSNEDKYGEALLSRRIEQRKREAVPIVSRLKQIFDDYCEINNIESIDKIQLGRVILEWKYYNYGTKGKATGWHIWYKTDYFSKDLVLVFTSRDFWLDASYVWLFKPYPEWNQVIEAQANLLRINVQRIKDERIAAKEREALEKKCREEEELRTRFGL